MEIIETNGVPIKAWIDGVGVEDQARKQLINTASLPIVFHPVAVMPAVHFGMVATVGSVVPTEGAIIPAAVEVDVGCGMVALQTDLSAAQLPDSLKELRFAIEKVVPHGRSSNGGKGDRGAWHKLPGTTARAWKGLSKDYETILDKHPRIRG